MSAGTHNTASAPVPCAGATSIPCPLGGGCPQAVQGLRGVVTSARGSARARLGGARRQGCVHT